MLKLILGLASLSLVIIILLIIFVYFKRRPQQEQNDIERTDYKYEDEAQTEDLLTFHGGQDLTISDILDAPGEVIGKSNYGTLYKALLQRSNCVRLLRFLRPVCTARIKDFWDVIQLLGCIRHPNLVPLLGFYAGPRGEKLLISPFFRHGNLAQFIRGKLFSFCLFFWISVCLIA